LAEDCAPPQDLETGCSRHSNRDRRNKDVQSLLKHMRKEAGATLSYLSQTRETTTWAEASTSVLYRWRHDFRDRLEIAPETQARRQ